MPKHEKINYIEFPAHDLDVIKDFFADVFGWKFTDYGPEYTAFFEADTGLDGGFYLADKRSNTESGAALVVFFSDDLAKTQAKITEFGGKICQEIFNFPGGRRFHFTDPNGNEHAVWGK